MFGRDFKSYQIASWQSLSITTSNPNETEPILSERFSSCRLHVYFSGSVGGSTYRLWIEGSNDGMNWFRLFPDFGFDHRYYYIEDVCADKDSVDITARILPKWVKGVITKTGGTSFSISNCSISLSNP